jgi:hypothetical protein
VCGCVDDWLVGCGRAMELGPNARAQTKASKASTRHPHVRAFRRPISKFQEKTKRPTDRPTRRHPPTHLEVLRHGQGRQLLLQRRGQLGKGGVVEDFVRLGHHGRVGRVGHEESRHVWFGLVGWMGRLGWCFVGGGGAVVMGEGRVFWFWPFCCVHTYRYLSIDAHSPPSLSHASPR